MVGSGEVRGFDNGRNSRSVMVRTAESKGEKSPAGMPALHGKKKEPGLKPGRYKGKR